MKFDATYSQYVNCATSIVFRGPNFSIITGVNNNEKSPPNTYVSITDQAPVNACS